MARMRSIWAPGEYAIKLDRLGHAQEKIAEKATAVGAGIIADEMRSNLENVLSGESSGDLEDSMGITPMEVDNHGNYNRKIGFDGYDSKGVPNPLKARAKESGTSKQKKTPFIRPAVRAKKEEASTAMGRVVEEETKKIMKG